MNIAIHVISSIVRPVPSVPQRSNLRIAQWGGSTIVLAMIALVGCTGGGEVAEVVTSTTIENVTTTTIERANDGVLKLGVYLPRTGEGAALGEPMIQAVEEAVAAINTAGGVLGNNIEVEIVDEGGDSGPDELITGGVDAIVGPASSLVALAQLATLVQPTTGVVTCSPTATAMALDDFSDRDGLFFRTAPSDSLQMAAIARRVEDTGETSVTVGYLDDPYGRGLVASFAEVAGRQGLDLRAEVGFSGDQEDLSDVVAELLAESPGVIVVLGDTDDGSRLLAAIDEAAATDLRRVIVNDAIRGARQTIQSLTPAFRQRLIGVAPNARSLSENGPEGFFTAHAVDCVNLIALATILAESDAPSRIKTKIGEVASGGRVCTSFDACVALLDQDLQIDYNGFSGSVDLSNSAGDPVRAWFESFSFDADGIETSTLVFEVQ